MTDRSEHVEALGEWCDCDGCLVSRENFRTTTPAHDARASAAPSIAEVAVLAEHRRTRERLRNPDYLGEFRGQVAPQSVPLHPIPDLRPGAFVPVDRWGRPLPSWSIRSAEPPRRIDRRLLVMWVLLGAFALGMAYAVGGH